MLNIENLKNVRLENNKSQAEVAEALGVSRGTYSMWECNMEVIPIKRLICFCEYFGVALDYIFGFKCKQKEIKTKFELEKQGERLKQFRKEWHLTQRELENLFDFNNGVICKYENNTNIISTIVLYTICSKYGVSADYLLGRTDGPTMLDKK